MSTTNGLIEYPCSGCGNGFTTKRSLRKFNICPACKLNGVSYIDFRGKSVAAVVPDSKPEPSDWCCKCGTGIRGVYCKSCKGE